MSFLLTFDLVNTRSGTLEEWEYVVLRKDGYALPPPTDAHARRGELRGLILSWRALGSYFSLFRDLVETYNVEGGDLSGSAQDSYGRHDF